MHLMVTVCAVRICKTYAQLHIEVYSGALQSFPTALQASALLEISYDPCLPALFKASSIDAIPHIVPILTPSTGQPGYFSGKFTAI